MKIHERRNMLSEALFAYAGMGRQLTDNIVKCVKTGFLQGEILPLLRGDLSILLFTDVLQQLQPLLEFAHHLQDVEHRVVRFHFASFYWCRILPLGQRGERMASTAD